MDKQRTLEGLKKLLGDSDVEILERIADHILEEGIIRYRCAEPECSSTWTSKKIEFKCPECDSKFIKITFKKPLEIDDGKEKRKADGLLTYDIEEGP